MRRPAKKLYWRPTQVPGRALFVLLVAAAAAMFIVETFTNRQAAGYYDEMLRAARLMEKSIETLRPIRGRIQPINPDVDPQRSGLIGIASSPVTSSSGHLLSKQSSINPNWAAVVVRLLHEAGVERGDTVAVAVSGSFPAFNLAVYSALEILEVEPLIIVSGAASQWGANVPGFIWPDMARELRTAGLLNIKAVAASLGGEEDRGVGLSKEGTASIRRSIERAGIPLLEPDSYRAAVSERIAVYREHAGDREIKALINTGGGTATTGPDSIDHFFKLGLSYTASAQAFATPSVMGYFLEHDVPVINLSGVKTLSIRYGLPYPPESEPRVGSGEVYSAVSYRRWLAALMIACLLGLTALIMRSAHIALTASQSEGKTGTLKPKV